MPSYGLETDEVGDIPFLGVHGPERHGVPWYAAHAVSYKYKGSQGEVASMIGAWDRDTGDLGRAGMRKRAWRGVR